MKIVPFQLDTSEQGYSPDPSSYDQKTHARPEGSRGQIASFPGSFPENGYEAWVQTVHMSSIWILLVFW